MAEESQSPFEKPGLQPIPGEVRVIGSNAKGCLVGAQALSSQDPCYVLVNADRGRYFGTPALVNEVSKISQYACQKFQQSLLVADAGLPRGGPLPTDHAGHQIGIDVDIRFRMIDKNSRFRLEQVKPDVNKFMNMAEFGPPVATSDKDGRKTYSLKSAMNWGENDPRFQNVADLIQHVAKEPGVERVLVNPVIKKALCELAKKRAKKTPDDLMWLMKVRVVPGHLEHFHVRVQAPNVTVPYKYPEKYPDQYGIGCDPQQMPLSYWLKNPTTWNPDVPWDPKKELSYLEEWVLDKECKKTPTAKACPPPESSTAKTTEIPNQECRTIVGGKIDENGNPYKRSATYCLPKECWELAALPNPPPSPPPATNGTSAR